SHQGAARPCGKDAETWGRCWGELAPTCARDVQNFPFSTETPGCPLPPPTGPVDKIWALTCGNRVIHGIHRPYYYSQLERARNSFRRGSCAQLGASTPTAPRHDLTPRGTYCQCGASDWSPVSFPAPGAMTPSQTTKPGRARSAGNSRRRQQ